MKLDKFIQTKLSFTNATETGAKSQVDRLPPNSNESGNIHSMVHFRKVIAGGASALVKNEERILSKFHTAKVPNTVHLLDYYHSPAKGTQTIITESAGVDLFGWYNVPLYINEINRDILDIYSHPLFFMQILKHSIIALKEVHKQNIVHCDIKLDNICLPFKGNNPQFGKPIQIDLSKVTLIDFGQSYWIGNMGDEDRNWLGYIENEKDRYQSRYLINILKQWFKDNQRVSKPPYNNSSLSNIDYSCDLYGLGVVFDSLYISHYTNNDVWQLVKEDLHNIIINLKDYDNGIIGKYKNKLSMPHDDFISRLDILISKIISFEHNKGNAFSSPNVINGHIIVSDLSGQQENSIDTPRVVPTPIVVNIGGNGDENITADKGGEPSSIKKKGISQLAIGVVSAMILGVVGIFAINANKSQELPAQPASATFVSTATADMISDENKLISYANEVYDVYEQDKSLEESQSIFDEMIAKGNVVAHLAYADVTMNLERDNDKIDSEKYQSILKEKGFDVNIIQQLDLLADKSYGASWLSADYRYWADDQMGRFQYLQKMAKFNKPLSLYVLANMHIAGKGTAKQPSEALLLFRKSAELGNTKSINTLAIMYEYGVGTPVNYDEALKWYSQEKVIDENYVNILEVYKKIVNDGQITPTQIDHLTIFTWRANFKQDDSTLELFELLNKELLSRNGKLSPPEELLKKDDLSTQRLLNLILISESIDDDKRQYWFDIYPSMTTEQRENLHQILDTERIEIGKFN